MPAAISTQQLAVTFGRRGAGTVHALRPLDLAIERGRIVGLLGPNGSGKTTLLRVLAGLQRPSQGTVAVLDLPPDDRSLRGRVAYQPEGALPLDSLGARAYLQYFGAAQGLPNAIADARIEALLQRVELAHTGRAAVRTFSTGMQKRLQLATALLPEPELLLLDEPTSGLDPFGCELVMTILRERAATGATVLMASHHLLEVEQICDEVLVLERGELAARGPLGDLLATDEWALAVRGLDDAALQQLAANARAAGASSVRLERSRGHLFALFRALSRRRPAEPR